MEPVRPPSKDGIYPRCVWCNGENYSMAVIAYSSGEIPCAAVDGCGRTLPEHYIKGRCPTPCDDDCETDCHEEHDVPYRREHDPATCPGRHA